jgi:hypothetical protein
MGDGWVLCAEFAVKAGVRPASRLRTKRQPGTLTIGAKDRSQSAAETSGPMYKLVLIAALILVSLALTPLSVQAQTAPTNATTNSQLANSNTANALGITTGGPTTGRQQSSSQSGPATGVLCIQEMTATFCNVPSGPNTNGYGSAGGSGSTGATGSSGAGGGGGSASGAGSATASASSGGAGANTTSIPTCGGFPSANELCN